jgi:hypothetical protein
MTTMDNGYDISSAEKLTKHIESLILLPLAITVENENWGCVAGIDSGRRWLRPSPIPSDWVRNAGSAFHYKVWSRLTISPHPTSNRLEDRLIEGTPVSENLIETVVYHKLLATIADPDVCAAFAGARSVGLIRARVEEIYARPHTRGRTLLRIIFKDSANERYDWIIPEVATAEALAPYIRNAATLDPNQAKLWLDQMEASEVFLAIGLTLPNNRLPGRFGGCHPLIVGIHRFQSQSIPGGKVPMIGDQ